MIYPVCAGRKYIATIKSDFSEDYGNVARDDNLAGKSMNLHLF